MTVNKIYIQYMMIIKVKVNEIEKHSQAKFKIQGEIQTKDICYQKLY